MRNCFDSNPRTRGMYGDSNTSEPLKCPKTACSVDKTHATNKHPLKKIKRQKRARSKSAARHLLDACAVLLHRINDLYKNVGGAQAKLKIKHKWKSWSSRGQKFVTHSFKFFFVVRLQNAVRTSREGACRGDLRTTVSSPSNAFKS